MTRGNRAFISVSDLHEKMDQLYQSFISHEETLLLDMYQRLTEQQNEVYTTILKNIEQNTKSNTGILKRLPAPDNDFQTEMSNLETNIRKSNPETSSSIPDKVYIKTKTADTLADSVPNRVVDIIEISSDSSSSTSPVSIERARKNCYENWDYIEHEELKKLILVDFRKLDNILDTIVNKGHLTFDNERNRIITHSLTVDDMNNAKKLITTLSASKVSKYERFPTTGNFVDINLNSKNNAELKMMLMTTDANTFYYSARISQWFIKKNVLDQLMFENIHGLQWTTATHT